MARRFAHLLMLALWLAPFTASQAIIIRHDKADSGYRVNELDYPQLFFLHTSFGNRVCVATLVSPHWALTAAHCARETPLGNALGNGGEFTLTIVGRSYRVTELVLHPQYDPGSELDTVDLALVRLDRDVPGVIPAHLYRLTDEQDKVFSLLGWGFTGIGTRGRQGNDGRFRRAENRVSAAGQWLEFLFDDPRQPGNGALDLEGVPGLGDSGGPALLETDEGLVIAGIAVGELEEGESPEFQGLYGTTQIYERVSSHLGWIEGIIAK